jgi:hypothetical protein
MSGGKGSTETGVDKFTKQTIQELMEYGKQVGQIPYQPWTGDDVAGFTTQGMQGMQAMSDMGAAFGMNPKTNIASTIPQGNLSGYGAYKNNLKQVATDFPETAKRYAEFYKLPVDALYGAQAGTAPPSGGWTPGTGSGTGSGSSGGGGSTGGKGTTSDTNPFAPGYDSTTGTGGKGPDNAFGIFEPR